MKISEERLERLRQSLKIALDREWPTLDAARQRLAVVPTHPIRPMEDSRRISPIATVAADGGENRLHLEPLQVQVLRVADSTGEIHFEEFIALSGAPAELLEWFSEASPQLNGLLRYLGLRPNELITHSESPPGNALAMVRELMEWGTLLKLASRPPARLLVRDGLLRSVLLPEKAFQKLRERFVYFSAKHGHLLCGVAKRSQVLNYLSLALNLQESFKGGEPSWIEIPSDLERQAAPIQYRWVGPRAMGSLHIARLDRGANVPILPVDIASWQRQRVDQIMTLLHESARASFPHRGYPWVLAQAHENARLDQLQIEVLESVLLEQVRNRATEVGQQLEVLLLLGRNLIQETV